MREARFTRVLEDAAVIRYLETTPAHRIPLKEVDYGGRPSRCGAANGGLALSRVISRSQQGSNAALLPKEYWRCVDLAAIPVAALTRCAGEVAGFAPTSGAMVVRYGVRRRRETGPSGGCTPPSAPGGAAP